jgi:hypothetical protein
MARKKNGKWWICIDFTNLNKCCLKDNFPLARINKIIDSAIGCEMMALLDCFLAITRYVFAEKMRRQVSSPHLAHTATFGCLRGSAMLGQHSAE